MDRIEKRKKIARYGARTPKMEHFCDAFPNTCDGLGVLALVCYSVVPKVDNEIYVLAIFDMTGPYWEH